jgi:regulator of RNase E activity RraA
MDEAKRKELLDLYEGLRTADVRDALDAHGYFNIGSVDPEIKPLWKDLANLKHKICGFAFTARYLPTNKLIHPESPEDYREKGREFMQKYGNCSDVHAQIKEGDILVFDCGKIPEWGGFGSEFAKQMMAKKVRGFITNNSVRDSDEISQLQFPVHCKTRGRGHRIGRTELDACNVKINLGEALVCPGDMIVADGDGIIVVPQELAEMIGRHARGIYEKTVVVGEVKYMGRK